MKRITLTILAICLSFIQMEAQVKIINSTCLNEAGQYAEIIANEIMEFDTLSVIIFPLPKGSTIEGAVVKNKCVPHTYTLLINESISIKRLRVMVSHEFVHIKQYEHEGLEIFGDIWCWNPDGRKDKQDVTWGSMTFTEYETRGFELDAFERQWIINKQLTKIIKERK